MLHALVLGALVDLASRARGPAAGLGMLARPQSARASVLTLQTNDEAQASPQWVQGTLANGDAFWWWFDGDEDRIEDAEVSLEQPPDAWRVGELSDGSPYTWRVTEDSDDPEIMIWSKGELSSGCVASIPIICTKRVCSFASLWQGPLLVCR